MVALEREHLRERRADLERVPEVKILAESDEAGIYIVESTDQRHVYITGHSEYDPLTLKSEYERDVGNGLPIDVPRNYYPHDDPGQPPRVCWRGHASLLYANWLNYYVYQVTPFDPMQIPQGAMHADF